MLLVHSGIISTQGCYRLSFDSSGGISSSLIFKSQVSHMLEILVYSSSLLAHDRDEPFLVDMLVFFMHCYF
jgi:hypothetical protein